MIGAWMERHSARMFWGAVLVVLLMTMGGC